MHGSTTPPSFLLRQLVTITAILMSSEEAKAEAEKVPDLLVDWGEVICPLFSAWLLTCERDRDGEHWLPLSRYHVQ